MATLAQATQATRSLLKWGGVAIVVFIILRYLIFPIGFAMYRNLFPKKPPVPTTTFGKLPRIPFPSGDKFTNTIYTINTTTGTLPPTCLYNTCTKPQDPTNPLAIPDRLTVHPITKQTAIFSSYASAKQKVSDVGFTGEGKALTETMYLWQHPKVPGRQIVFDIITQKFDLTSDMASIGADLMGSPPSVDTSIDLATSFLSNINLLPKDIDETKTQTLFFKLTAPGDSANPPGANSLIPATSLSDSSFIQVDFHRKPLEDLPILNPYPQPSLLSFLVRTAPEKKLAIVEGHFSYKPLDKTTSATYPIKTAQQAFTELQEGKAYILPGSTKSSRIAIQKVYLAYYEGSDSVRYFLPIFVFEGENSFVAYVEAIQDQWLE